MAFQIALELLGPVAVGPIGVNQLLFTNIKHTVSYRHDDLDTGNRQAGLLPI